MSYPLVVRNDNGVVTSGLLHDLGLAIARQLKVELVPLSVSRNRMESAVRNGQVDMVCFWSPLWAESPETMRWTTGTLPQVERIVTRRGQMIAQPTAEYFDNKRIATQLGYRYGTLQPLFDSGRVRRVDETRVGLMFKSLDVGATDALVTSEDEIEGYFYTQPKSRQRFEISSFVFSKVTTQCAVSMKSPHTLAHIDSAINAIIQRGELARIAKSYRLSPR